MLTAVTEEWIKQNGFDKDNINYPGKYQDTPLILACRHGQTDIADELIEAGADVNHSNMDGTTLMYASSAGKTPWVEYFLEKGADTQVQSLDDFTALDLASNVECLKLLKRAIASKLEASPA